MKKIIILLFTLILAFFHWDVRKIRATSFSRKAAKHMLKGITKLPSRNLRAPSSRNLR